MKVSYRGLGGSISTAYVDDTGADVLIGSDKYTDETVALKWNGSCWVEIPTDDTVPGDGPYDVASGTLPA